MISNFHCCLLGTLLLNMAPPVYADLGKSSRDVFGKGYHFSLLKLECKTKTSNGVEFTTGGSSNLDSGKVVGNLETKYKVPEYGIVHRLSLHLCCNTNL